MSEHSNAAPPPVEESSGDRYADNPGAKTADFLIGLFGLIGGLVVMYGLLWGATALIAATPSLNNNPQIAPAIGIGMSILGFAPCLTTVGLLIYFAFRRRWIALGMLTGIAVPLVLAVCAMILTAVVCFSSSLNLSG